MDIPVSLEFLSVGPEDRQALEVRIVAEQEYLEPRVGAEVMLAEVVEIVVAEIEIGELVEVGEGVLVDALEIVGAQVELVEVGYAAQVLLGDHLQSVHRGIQRREFRSSVSSEKPALEHELVLYFIVDTGCLREGSC